jgi:hypothetical protein
MMNSRERRKTLWCIACTIALLSTGAVVWTVPSAPTATAQLTEAAYLPLVAKSIAMDQLPPAATAVPSPSTTPSQVATSLPTPSATTAALDCSAVPTFADGLTPERYIHVSPTGSDDDGDGTPASPYATVGRALHDVAPGSAIAIHQGRYEGGVYAVDLEGEPHRPIWLGGAEGEDRPVFEGGSVGLHLIRASYLVVHDLEVSGASSNGINCDDGGDYADPLATHHVVFRNVSIHDIGGTGNQDCLKLSGLNDYTVVDSQFARCGGGSSGSGIDQVGCHDGLIARNSFADHSGNAIQAKGGSADIEIRWNRIVSGGARAINMGGSTGFEYFRPPLDGSGPNAEARRIHAYGNVIAGGDTPFAFVGCVDCRAQANTVIEPRIWLMRILQETNSSGGYEFEPSRSGVVANNLFVFRRSQIRTYLNIGSGTEPDTFTFETNLWYAADAPDRSQPELPAPENRGVVGADPLLRPDHSIGPDSPAAGAGTAPAGPPGDITGACWSSPPSIGAYEVRP